jgi:hypothetical protein
MINKLKQTAKNLWEKFVIHRYVSSGLYWGDLESYTFMGEPYRYGSACNSLDFWEAQYEKLGYLPINREEWVAAGGYGRTEYKSRLKIKKVPKYLSLKK